jgi:homoserine acetyltransferase
MESASFIFLFSYFLNRSTRYASLNDFLREDWEAGFLEGWDANDLLTLLKTWQIADVSLIRDGGYFTNCLGAIKARGLIMPCKTDLYFPVGPFAGITGLYLMFLV